MKKKDNLFKDGNFNDLPFSFNEEVTEVFEDMIDRSVPGYESSLRLIKDLSEHYFQSDTYCYDLGCSLGASSLSLLEGIGKRKGQVIAIDNSHAMISESESRFSNFIKSGKIKFFEQDINYSIKLLLSELLSSKFRKKNTDPENEFGEIDKNGKPFTTLYLKMVGKTDNPKIYFDGLRINKNLRKGIKQEKETITSIIKQDVLKSEKREKENDDIIIEWKDE